MAKISGPLLDRIDIHLEVPALKIDELTQDGGVAESSEEIRKRVLRTQEIQKKRFGGLKVYANTRMNSKQVKKFCRLDPESKSLLSAAIEKLSLSARAYDRILKVARTIADLAGAEDIRSSHVAEAIQYRSLDKTRN